MPAIMERKRREPEEDDHANEGIGNGEPRRNQGTEDVAGDLRPVKGNRNQREPTPASENLVKNHVVGLDERDKSKYGEEWGNVAGNPIPDKGSQQAIQKVPIPANRPAVGFGRVGGRVIVKRVKDGRADEILGPDHGGW